MCSVRCLVLDRHNVATLIGPSGSLPPCIRRSAARVERNPELAHQTVKESYRKLSERLNRFPQGAPPTELLFQILEVLFSPEEAELVALLPIKPFNVKAAAAAWKKTEAEARAVLDKLASRGMMLDTEIAGEQAYVMPPPMAGFFEFSMMRIGNHYDQKLLAELFYQYLNVEEDFVRALCRRRDAAGAHLCQ